MEWFNNLMEELSLLSRDWIYLVAAVALEIVVVIYYLRIMYPVTSWKTLFTKLTCSSLFVIVAFLASLIRYNTSGYCGLMLIAFMASFLGDFFLHVKPKLGSEIVNYILGAVSFATGHICFILAYYEGCKYYFRDESIFRRQELELTFLLVIAVFIIFRLLKIKMGKMTIPILIYTSVLVSMMVKASFLGWRIYEAGYAYGAAAAWLLNVGSTLFTISDIALAVSFFSNKRVYLNKVVNISTYYAGQLLLALSLLFVYG